MLLAYNYFPIDTYLLYEEPKQIIDHITNIMNKTLKI